eukprot:TRINITY_DN17591_c0_g1_i1.p1 TRINITY_DN17591_c0_g1~~TRINITY_DN17591_c0_g1_i1.p1  ORF type:complete len:497 (+),score=25.87 TRINITY_DN17591_c0_g1_i1:108-1598(+)
MELASAQEDELEMDMRSSNHVLRKKAAPSAAPLFVSPPSSASKANSAVSPKSIPVRLASIPPLESKNGEQRSDHFAIPTETSPKKSSPQNSLRSENSSPKPLVGNYNSSSSNPSQTTSQTTSQPSPSNSNTSNGLPAYIPNFLESLQNTHASAGDRARADNSTGSPMEMNEDSSTTSLVTLQATTASPTETSSSNSLGVKGKTKVKFCLRCDFPVLIFGRLSPCQHAFCIECAQAATACSICNSAIEKIEEVSDFSRIHICPHSKCHRSYHTEYSLLEHQKLRKHEANSAGKSAETTSTEPLKSSTAITPTLASPEKPSISDSKGTSDTKNDSQKKTSYPSANGSQSDSKDSSKDSNSSRSHTGKNAWRSSIGQNFGASVSSHSSSHSSASHSSSSHDPPGRSRSATYPHHHPERIPERVPERERDRGYDDRGGYPPYDPYHPAYRHPEADPYFRVDPRDPRNYYDRRGPERGPPPVYERDRRDLPPPPRGYHPYY